MLALLPQMRDMSCQNAKAQCTHRQTLCIDRTVTCRDRKKRRLICEILSIRHQVVRHWFREQWPSLSPKDLCSYPASSSSVLPFTRIEKRITRSYQCFYLSNLCINGLNSLVDDGLVDRLSHGPVKSRDKSL